MVAEFDLANNFPQFLEIIDVVKGCSCTEATIERKHLEPKARTSLRILWNTGRSRGPHGINVEVAFKLADGKSYSKLLRVEGNVIPDLILDAEKLVFRGNGSETQTLRLAPGQTGKFKVLKSRSNHQAFKTEQDAGGGVAVTYDGKTPVWINGLEPKLILETDSPNEPQVIVPLEFLEPRPVHCFNKRACSRTNNLVGGKLTKVLKVTRVAVLVAALVLPMVCILSAIAQKCCFDQCAKFGLCNPFPSIECVNYNGDPFNCVNENIQTDFYVGAFSCVYAPESDKQCYFSGTYLDCYTSCACSYDPVAMMCTALPNCLLFYAPEYLTDDCD